LEPSANEMMRVYSQYEQHSKDVSEVRYLRFGNSYVSQLKVSVEQKEQFWNQILNAQ
jgi:hypothetical protein